jgi:hypothetical protein
MGSPRDRGRRARISGGRDATTLNHRHIDTTGVATAAQATLPIIAITARAEPGTHDADHRWPATTRCKRLLMTIPRAAEPQVAAITRLHKSQPAGEPRSRRVGRGGRWPRVSRR